MPMNRVHFHQGDSWPAFTDRYRTEDQCEQALIAALWPSGFVCPRCEATSARTTFQREDRQCRQCAHCQYRCSVLSGTAFEATQLSLRRWFMAVQLLTQSKNNVWARELKRQLGVCNRTAWLVRRGLLEAIRLAEADCELAGRVEVDDACLGGERSGSEAARGSLKFRALNTLIGNVKTALTGNYHAIKFAKHGDLSLSEIWYRSDLRHDVRAMWGWLFRALVATPRRPGCGISVAEVRRQSGTNMRTVEVLAQRRPRRCEWAAACKV